MNYFTQDFLDFFIELAGNNHKEWFDANRKRYEKNVKEPFKQLVSDLIKEIHDNYEPELLIEPKDAIFRINRDIRFAKDKTPYKTNLSALLSPKGRKNHSYPSFYFELGPEKVGVYGGCYGASTQELARLRQHLYTNHKEFLKLVDHKDFVKHYPDKIKGEQHKRAPKEFKEFAEKEPLILNKQFYYHGAVNPSVVPTENLFDTLMEFYKAGYPMMQFWRGALD